ncbi:cytochrome P450 family protein [Polyangium mundeleinium]|uniref:Cytochrome P450 n=1 Tax=Polyangium mundeleinium TaxID=2995306 RepID=A0ABT5EZB7_9BACT|nr:cytochrome P450 [Polyangium mundeleinium]MDC0746739.1 cytochrome P450 [Polyangium mundeleinium]
MHPLFTLEGRKDPHPIYKRLRAEEPAVQILEPYRKTPFWLLTRYADCSDMLRDPRFGKDFTKWSAEERARMHVSSEFDALGKHMLGADPPDHTRLRSIVAKAFTPQIVEGLRSRISAIAENLVSAAVARDSSGMDLVSQFSYPLPVTVIAELLGVPASDQDDFRRWTTTLFTPADTDEQLAHLRATGFEFFQYFMALIERRRAEPRDDLVSGLVAAEEGGDRLSTQELVGMLFLLLVAGHETTVNLITNGMLALMDHPEERERLVADPSLLESAVEEMLRYCGPVETTTYRFALEDVEIGGVTIRKNELVLASLLSADHDESRFPDADRFDVGRKPNKHIAFGYGIHFCLGAPLARLEAVIAVETLLRRLPRMKLAVPREDLEPSSMLLLLHAKKRLPIQF